MAPFISREITDKIQEVENTKRRNEIAFTVLPSLIRIYPTYGSESITKIAFEYADEFMKMENA